MRFFICSECDFLSAVSRIFCLQRAGFLFAVSRGFFVCSEQDFLFTVSRNFIFSEQDFFVCSEQDFLFAVSRNFHLQ